MSCRSGKGDSPEKFRSRSEDHHQKEPSRYSFRHDYLQYCFIVFKFYLIYITICNGFFFFFFSITFCSNSSFMTPFLSYMLLDFIWLLHSCNKRELIFKYFWKACHFPIHLLLPSGPAKLPSWLREASVRPLEESASNSMVSYGNLTSQRKWGEHRWGGKTTLFSAGVARSSEKPCW